MSRDLPSPVGNTRVANLRAVLASKIMGQDHLLDRVCSLFQRGELGLTTPSRPRGSLLFVGPTGVGKTELANLVSKQLFGVPPLRFDMSEYQLPDALRKFLGNARDDEGLFGFSVKCRENGILLFDEVEKAHPLLLDLFLQIFEDGRVTLATGLQLDLRNFYIVFTSNIGSAESMRMESAPFASMERAVRARINETLRPELVGRINEVIVFRRLSYTIQRLICLQLVAAEAQRLQSLGFPLEITETQLAGLMREGYSRHLGARPMRGTVERVLQNLAVERAVLLDRRDAVGVLP